MSKFEEMVEFCTDNRVQLNNFREYLGEDLDEIGNKIMSNLSIANDLMERWSVDKIAKEAETGTPEYP